jgi:lipopolysaccharide transport system ATP-binding protein
MSDIVISVENVGKRYTLRHSRKGKGYTTFREVMTQQAVAPFRAIGKKIRLLNGWNGSHSNGSTSPSSNNSTENFWALKDLSFEVKQGEVVGIIGRNGAGKSTLLKILSRITEPTEGRIRIKGRVASLLEVGTGFHPELTGRENIYLNGSILGMSRAEIKAKFDEIVAFSEVEKFLDTPVKRYSSGMYVRLAFAVAAHLEPEILIVDEVLAVGDAEFQKKCLGKMHDVATGGRTVLFVSHNMQAVSVLCSRGLFLSGGSIAYAGTIQETIDRYLSTFSKTRGSEEFPDRRPGSGEYRYIAASPAREYFGGAEEKTVNFEIQRRNKLVGRMWLSALIVDSGGIIVAQCDSRLVGTWIEDCERVAGQFRFTTPWLKPGSYRIDLFICAGPIVDRWEGACSLMISPVLPYLHSASQDVTEHGLIFADFAWETGELITDGRSTTMQKGNGETRNELHQQDAQHSEEVGIWPVSMVSRADQISSS